MNGTIKHKSSYAQSRSNKEMSPTFKVNLDSLPKLTLTFSVNLESRSSVKGNYSGLENLEKSGVCIMENWIWNYPRKDKITS